MKNWIGSVIVGVSLALGGAGALAADPYPSKRVTFVVPFTPGGAGDLMCRVAVETPVHLDKRQRELLEEFRQSLAGDSSHSPKANGWFEGVKRFFGDL